MSEPLVSVIVVNHDGIVFVEECLKSVLSSLYGNFEVIFVDNGSTDGSLEYVKKTFGSDSRLRFVENKESLGPAVGRNRGVAIAQGEYCLFLDNDTFVDKNCIQELINVFQQDRTVGSAQAKLLRMGSMGIDKFYDCAGDYIGPLGFLIERSRGAKDVGQFDYISDILSAKSAASIIRKDLFEQIGGFDEDFYMYLEETDLSWRVWLTGYRVVFVPKAIVHHAFNTPKKDFKRYYPKRIVRYYGCRNYISTLIKNLEFINLAVILPLHLGCWFLLALFFTLKGDREDAFLILKGIVWNSLNLRFLFAKRRKINTEIRVMRDNKILPRVMDKKGVDYYLGKALAYVTGSSF